ncbi:MAG: hypothetical protein U1F43_10230 [Myxococcota bacterium]
MMARLPFSLALALASAAPAAGLVGCGDDPATIIDLTVVETLPVQFDAMQGGVTEGAVVALGDLRDEPAYADAQTKLRCAAVDAKASSLTVEALDATAGATAVEYIVSVAPHGQTTFTELAHFSGSVGPNEVVTLDSSKFTLNAAGMSALSQVVLGASPELDVQMTATVPAALANMQLALKLSLQFSSDPKGCPSLTTGL